MGSSCRTPEALDLDMSKFNLNLTGFDWPHLTLDLHLLRVDLTLIGFPVTRRTCYRLRCYSLDPDRLCCPSPGLQQASPTLVEPLTGFAVTCRTFDGCRYLWFACGCDMWLRIWAPLLRGVNLCVSGSIFCLRVVVICG